MDTIKAFQNKVDKLEEKRVKQILKDLIEFVNDRYDDYSKNDYSKSIVVGFAITNGWLFNQLNKR